MKIYHACIFAPYAELSGVVDVWTTKSASLLVVEHPAEGKTQRIHCHFLIETESGENWFRDEAKSVMGEYIKRGNYWIATRVQKGEHQGKLLSRQETAKYMIKGKYLVNFAKNFSIQELESLRQEWVETDKSDIPGKDSERLIKQVMDRVKSNFLWHDTIDDEVESNFNERALLSLTRNTTFKVLYARNRMFPHGSHYKIIAGSAYCRLAEEYKCFDSAVKIISELWL